jgi:hypothetical protein
MRSLVQTLMNVCINVSSINAIYKHVHHGIDINFFFEKIKNKFIHGMLYCHACCEKNRIYAFMIWEKKWKKLYFDVTFYSTSY